MVGNSFYRDYFRKPYDIRSHEMFISRTHVIHKVINKVLQPVLLELTRFNSIGSPVFIGID